MRTAIVTGGERGIGRAIADHLSSKGFAVLVVDLCDGSGFKRDGQNLHSMVGDIADEAIHSHILDRAQSLGTLACLVNNAGVSSTIRGDLLDLPPKA